MKRQNTLIKKSAVEYHLTLLKTAHYELECYYFWDLSEPLLYVWDCSNSEYNVVGDFFRFQWDDEDILETLIPRIENLIASNIGNELIASVWTSAFIEPETTYFSSKNDLSNVKEELIGDTKNMIQTKLFLKIIRLWHCFLVLSKHRKPRSV